MRDWLKLHPLTGILLFGVAIIGALLRYGFPPGEGWLKFIGAMILFGGISYAVLLTDRYTRRS